MKKLSISDNRRGYSLSALSNTRAYLMGIATIMIVAFHSYIKFSVLLPDAEWLATIMDTVRKACTAGVDIFLFVSGMGLYYSLSSNKSLKDYYKKRATRILPPVLLVAVYWFAQRGTDGLADYLKNVTFISFYEEGTRYFWYFALIIFLYAIYPLMHKLLDKLGIFGALILIGVTVTGTILYKKFDYQQFLYIEIALTRIPVFVVGAYLGKHVKNGVNISCIWIIVAALLIIPAGYLGFYQVSQWADANVGNYGTLVWIQRGMGNLIGICLVFVCSAVLDKIKLGFFTTFLVWIGTYSMELYLVHEKLGIQMFNELSTGDPSLLMYYSVTFILSIPLAMALKAFTDSLNKNLFYRSKESKSK